MKVIRTIAKDYFTESEVVEKTIEIISNKSPEINEPYITPTQQNIDNYILTGSYVHLPNLDEKDYIIGGVWKLQGLHKDAYSFSQRVRGLIIDQIEYIVDMEFEVK